MTKDSDEDVAPPVLDRDRARALRAAQTEVERRLWQRLRNDQPNGVNLSASIRLVLTSRTSSPFKRGS